MYVSIMIKFIVIIYGENICFVDFCLEMFCVSGVSKNRTSNFFQITYPRTNSKFSIFSHPRPYITYIRSVIFSGYSGFFKTAKIYHRVLLNLISMHYFSMVISSFSKKKSNNEYFILQIFVGWPWYWLSVSFQYRF